ncbi:SCY1-like protein 2 isoform X2 [Planococcus citri]|uniref:SCY1-like protein 2 isoform X2 n=1 Tax=Planococcus citri TaxID=170843 RepID=UPI0031F97AF5
MQEPVQIQLICLQKVELMLKLALADEIKSEILPVLFRALESNSKQLQEQCLSVIPTFAPLIHYQTMNRDLMPRIEKLYKYNYTSVRVNCLDCIGKLVEHLDLWGIWVDLLNFLYFLRVEDRKEPEILMSIAGIYKNILNHKKVAVPAEVIAEKMFPVLMCVEYGEEVPLPLEMPLSIENSLTVDQFNAIMTVVEEMVNVVVAEIEQLYSMQEQQKNLELTSEEMEELRYLFKINTSDKSLKKQEIKPSNLCEKQRNLDFDINNISTNSSDTSLTSEQTEELQDSK